MLILQWNLSSKGIFLDGCISLGLQVTLTQCTRSVDKHKAKIMAQLRVFVEIDTLTRPLYHDERRGSKEFPEPIKIGGTLPILASTQAARSQFNP